MARRFIRRPRSEPISLARILDGSLTGAARNRPLLRTFSWWERAVPERVVQNARPVRLEKGGTLVVHTRSAAWAQELSFHEHDLLASVQRRVPAIRRLRLRVGPMPAPPTPPEPMPAKTVPLPVGKLPAEVARGLAKVGDDRLRDTLTRAACTSLAPPPREPPRPMRRRRGPR